MDNHEDTTDITPVTEDYGISQSVSFDKSPRAMDITQTMSYSKQIDRSNFVDARPLLRYVSFFMGDLRDGLPLVRN